MTEQLLPLGDVVPTDDVAGAAEAVRRRSLEMLLDVGQRRLLKPSEYKQLQQLLGEFQGQGPVATNTEQLGEALGVSKRTVLRWLQDGAPVRDDGLYEVDQVRAWRAQKDGSNGAGAGATDWNRELKAEQAQLQRTKREQLQGVLVSRAKVARLLAARVAVVKSTLLSSVPRLAELLAGVESRQEVATLLDDELRHIVAELARALPPELDQLSPCPECGAELRLYQLTGGNTHESQHDDESDTEEDNP